MRRFRAGDVGAFEVLLRRHLSAIHTFHFRFTGDAGRAEDLTQKTWLGIIFAAPHWQGWARFRTWALCMARTLAVDEARRAARQATHCPDGSCQDGASLFEGVASGVPGAESALLPELEAALAALPVEEREVFILREWTGVRFAQIAEITGVPVATVKSRMRHGLEALRAELRERGVLPGAESEARNARPRRCRERLLELLYGELSQRESASMERHLSSCEACRREFGGMAATVGAMRELKVPRAGGHGSPALVAAARRAAGQWRAESLGLAFRRFSLRILIGTAFAVALALLVQLKRLPRSTIPVAGVPTNAEPRLNAPAALPIDSRTEVGREPAERSRKREATGRASFLEGHAKRGEAQAVASGTGDPAKAPFSTANLAAGELSVGPFARDLERRIEAGRLSEAHRRLVRCAGGDIARTAWIDGGQHVVKLARDRADGLRIEEWFDESGRLREALVRSGLAGGPIVRHVMVSKDGEESVQLSGRSADALSPALVRSDPSGAFFSDAGCKLGK